MLGTTTMTRVGRIGAGALAAGALVAGSAVPGAEAIAPAASTAAGDVRTTVAYVVDGDTIHARIGGKVEKIRVIGVDTPELAKRQCYATQAKAATTQLVYRKTVVLRADRTQPNRDVHGRLLRHVILTDGTKLGQRLISNGFGRELTVGKPYIGQPTYRKDQARAKAKKRGLWKACGSPAPVLTRPKPAPKPAPKPVAGCTIKGNIANDGEKIYHKPGQRYYNATKIDRSKGERMFCSEAEARRAGWRPAKV
ncbi:thermonuclease family protein [Mobilicoccus caccae]|uniref:TNase-like domain-containing protein n=1 Tax=Mobilicoccus caccae TaxID=1859295 RepID=A0ABQ6IPN6_9MICO|nr:thermonuclease family protein [Mobilicoccus caccae]GMA39849.1 hypothetical protein GCM10025883_18940 [Mobilicoccus caccae]